MINFSKRKKEMLFIVLSNLFLQVTTIICGFILPPLIIRNYGSVMNGMVVSVTQFISYLNIVEAGVGGAAIAAMYKPLSKRDVCEQSGILSASSKFFNRSGVLFVGLVCILAIIYPFLVASQINALMSGGMVLVIGVTGAAEFFLIGKYRVLLTADKRVYIISIVQTIAVVANTLLSVVLIRFSLNLLVVKAIASLVYLSRWLYLSWYVRRSYPSIDFHAEPDFRAISQSRSVLIHQIGGLVVFNTPLVLITLFCNLIDVSVYSIYAMVFSGVNSILASFSNGIQSFFGESLVRDELEQTRKIFGRYESIFLVVMAWVYSMTFILVMPFMKLYTEGMSDANYNQPTLAVLLVLSGIANQLRRPCDLMITASGHFKQTQWHSLLESAINLITSIFFIIFFGFIGVAMGSLCSFAYRTLDIIIYANRRILSRRVFYSLSKTMIVLSIFSFFLLIMSFWGYPSVDSTKGWIIYASFLGIILAIPAVAIILLFLRYND